MIKVRLTERVIKNEYALNHRLVASRRHTWMWKVPCWSDTKLLIICWAHASRVKVVP